MKITLAFAQDQPILPHHARHADDVVLGTLRSMMTDENAAWARARVDDNDPQQLVVDVFAADLATLRAAVDRIMLAMSNVGASWYTGQHPDPVTTF